jgi:hypothetical protein
MMKTDGFTSDAEVRALVLSFESGSQGLAEFSHPAHLAVALIYLADHSLATATAEMRVGLHRFLAHHSQSQGYHETLALFWMRWLDHLTRHRYSQQPLWQRVNEVVRSHGGSWPVLAHYSSECTASGRWAEHAMISFSITIRNRLHE